MPFIRELKVRFPDVDFARVVYYPRFFDYSHQVFEDFFAAEVGTAYSRMLTERKVGFPTVHSSADFSAPLRFGDWIEVEMSTEILSQNSITSRYEIRKDQTVVARLKVVTVPVDMDSFQRVPLPDDVRRAFERFLMTPP